MILKSDNIPKHPAHVPDSISIRQIYQIVHNSERDNHSQRIFILI